MVVTNIRNIKPFEQNRWYMIMEIVKILHDVGKLNVEELYSFSIFFKNTKPITQKYFQDYFSCVQLVWSDIYSLPRLVTIDSEIRYFQ